MTPAVRHRFTTLLVVDGVGTAAYCMRAARRPHAAALVDAAGAVAGWTAAARARRSQRADRAVRLVAAGTAATLVGAGLGVVASRRAVRPVRAEALLVAAGAALGGAHLLVLRDEPAG